MELTGTISYEDEFGNGRLSIEDGSIKYRFGKGYENGSKVKVIGELKFKEEPCICGAVNDTVWISVNDMILIEKGESIW